MTADAARESTADTDPETARRHLVTGETRLESQVLEAWSYISRLLASRDDPCLIGPLESFIDHFCELTGYDLPLIEPNTRTDVFSELTGQTIRQYRHKLGLSENEIAEVRCTELGGPFKDHAYSPGPKRRPGDDHA